ncbi:MAG: hypothetical protein ACRD2I_23680, partial [Vicinamibacterales bacterium]
MLQLALNLEPPTLNPEPRIPNPEPRTLNPDYGTRDPVLVFVRHPRARRYLIRVTDQGIVRVTIPRGGSRREAAAFAAREHAWVWTQLRRAEAERERRERERRSPNGQPVSPSDERQRGAEQREAIARARRELPPRLLE